MDEQITIFMAFSAGMLEMKLEGKHTRRYFHPNGVSLCVSRLDYDVRRKLLAADCEVTEGDDVRQKLRDEGYEATDKDRIHIRIPTWRNMRDLLTAMGMRVRQDVLDAPDFLTA